MARYVSFVLIALVMIFSFGFVNNAEAEISEVGFLDIPRTYLDKVATVRLTAFVTSWLSGLFIVDVSQPAEPRLLERYRGNVSDVEVMGDYVFVGFNDEQGLRIFYIDSLVYSGEPSNVRGMLLDGSLLYLTTGVDSVNILQILDISNPLEPSLLGQLEINHLGVPSILIDGRLLYMKGGNFEVTMISIIDVADPEQPELIEQLEHQGILVDIVTDGQYLFISNQAGGEGRNGLQVRTLDWELIFESWFFFPLQLEFNRGYLYLTAPKNGQDTTNLKVFDVSHPEQPELISGYASDRNPDDLWFDGELCYSTATEGLLILHVEIDNEEEVQPTPEGQPTDFLLNSAYPNPFNATTHIAFNLPQAGKAMMAVYDLSGKEVTRLVDGEIPAGSHSVMFDAQGLSAGIYFLRLQMPTGVRSQKLMLVK